MTDKKHLFP